MAGSELSLRLGNGALEFIDLQVPVGVPQSAVAILDVGGDGVPDIVLGTAAANRGSNGRGALQILSTDSAPVPKPTIAGVEVVGRKTLVVCRRRFRGRGDDPSRRRFAEDRRGNVRLVTYGNT